MKVVAFLLLVSFAITAHSQNTINNYKYVLVPERFDFLKTEDQYGLNSLAKSLLEGEGFVAFMSNGTLPADIAPNRCNALKLELVERKTFFVTALTLVLKDCLGNTIYKSQEGKSREKEWQPAYSEALRNAFSSLNTLHYKYDSTTPPQVVQTPVSTVPATTAAAPAVVADNSNVLYAQANANGYQLVDTTPKKVMVLLKTSQPDNFIADDGTSKGIVFRRNGEWFFEYYANDQLVSRKLNIRF